jgi:hypothetical protein
MHQGLISASFSLNGWAALAVIVVLFAGVVFALVFHPGSASIGFFVERAREHERDLAEYDWEDAPTIELKRGHDDT